MKNIHIENSYKIWDAATMEYLIIMMCYGKYNEFFPKKTLNRSYLSMYIEWWLHNIGYYVTKPFCKIEFFKKINLRCKDVDLNEWM
jgi:hypothetical protein